ncbi:uncharacterized protein [Paralichthys olivaceus]|uniref:uncharacterized protein isoform X3 n=1 Tax=Paralichthys olivaceus TaxID=8255 RepID=UPI0037512588
MVVDHSTSQSFSDSQVFVLRLKHCDAYCDNCVTFGEAIKLSVRPRDLSPVKPSLSVLSPRWPEGPRVCLAAGFRPPEGAMVLNCANSIDISEAVVSPRQKTFFFTGFSDGAISSCEMNNVSSSNDHENVRFNSYLLLLNAARVMFTKIVAFTSVLTIRTLLA